VTAASDEFRAALEAGDIKRVRKASAIVFSHLPQPTSDTEAEASMHLARTQMDVIPLEARAWSHCWLTERDLPSQLPDELKPSAERMYPRVVEAVLVAATARTDFMKPAAKIIQAAMSDAVEDCYADGKRDPAFVRARMQEARGRTIKSLFGNLGAQ
jgi:hypothetical protein